MTTTKTTDEVCYMPVNHNGTHLARAPMTLKAAKAELAEYTYQTENEGEIIVVEVA